MVSHMPVCTAGVAVAIAVSDRMYLGRVVQRALRAANLSHLLDILGLLTSLVFFFKWAIFSVYPI